MKYRFFFLIIILPLLLALVAGCSGQNGDVKTSREASTVKPAMTKGGSIPNKLAGSITGRVIYGGEAPERHKLMLVKDTDVCGRHNLYDERLIVGNNQGIQNAVVYLVGINGGKPLSSLGNKFILDQRGCRYQPHVELIPVNTPLEILNDDGILHNFHTFSKKNRPINMSQPKFRKTMEISFKEPEFIHARCDVHGWMSSWIIAVDHPYYAITNAEGGFSLTDIPPGTYSLNCWQEILGEKTEKITVAPGEIVSWTFTLESERQ